MRSDWVVVVRFAVAGGNGAENRAMSGRKADKPDGPWSQMHSTTMIPDESDLGSDERRVGPWQKKYN